MEQKKRKWAQEQIENRCDAKASVGAPEYGATIRIIPSFTGGAVEGGYGDEIRWDVKMFRQGTMEPTNVDRNNLMAVGCSEDEAASILVQVDNTADFLRRTYPTMKPGIERKPGFLRWVPSDD